MKGKQNKMCCCRNSPELSLRNEETAVNYFTLFHMQLESLMLFLNTMHREWFGRCGEKMNNVCREGGKKKKLLGIG